MVHNKQNKTLFPSQAEVLVQTFTPPFNGLFPCVDNVSANDLTGLLSVIEQAEDWVLQGETMVILSQISLSLRLDGPTHTSTLL